MTKKHFLHGALILTIAALISRILGAIYRIPLKQMTGDSGLAIYGAVYPVYSTILILVVAGIPVALSKMISEQVAVGNIHEVRRITRLSLFFISIIGLISFLALFFGASYIALWIGIPNAELSIQSVSFSLLIIPILSVLRGFFFGYQHITPPAVSQVVEQLFRVAMILVLTMVLIRQQVDLDVVISGATFATVIGVLASTIYLGIKYIRFNRSRIEIEITIVHAFVPSMRQIDLLKKISYFTIAISISSLMIPLFGLVDTFTGVNILESVLGSNSEAQEWFGVYNRFLPFVQLTTIFASALSLSLVPKIAESGVQQNNKDISHSAYLALKLTILIGLPASIGLALLSQEVNLLFYQDELGSLAFAGLAISSLFLTLAITTVAILQGLGKVFSPAIVLLIALVVKIGLNIVLIPLTSINGLALSTLSAYALIFIINGYVLSRNLPSFGGWTSLFPKPLFATGIMGVSLLIGERMLRNSLFLHPTRMQTIIMIVVLIGVGVLIYSIMILLLRGIAKHELLRIPKIGHVVVRLLERMHLLQRDTQGATVKNR